jgi:hypothetical protein
MLTIDDCEMMMTIMVMMVMITGCVWTDDLDLRTDGINVVTKCDSEHCLYSSKTLYFVSLASNVE